METMNEDKKTSLIRSVSAPAIPAYFLELYNLEQMMVEDQAEEGDMPVFGHSSMELDPVEPGTTEAAKLSPVAKMLERRYQLRPGLLYVKFSLLMNKFYYKFPNFKMRMIAGH